MRLTNVTLPQVSLMLTQLQANVNKIAMKRNILHLETSAIFTHNGPIYLHNYIHLLKGHE